MTIFGGCEVKVQLKNLVRLSLFPCKQKSTQLNLNHEFLPAREWQHGGTRITHTQLENDAKYGHSLVKE